MMQILIESGAKVAETESRGRTAWVPLANYVWQSGAEIAKFTSLLKVMVILDYAPDAFIAKLKPRHVRIATRGRQLRMLLPLYVEQQRTSIVAHCPLPNVLQHLVVSYATPSRSVAYATVDMWARVNRFA